jgi:DNA-binding PadR family transcriptional regulator
VKPSKMQAGILSEMAQGAELAQDVLGRKSFLWDGQFAKAVKYQTFMGLENQGWIAMRRKRADDQVWYYVITQAGREALEKAGNQP